MNKNNKKDVREALRQIPSIDEILNHFRLSLPVDFLSTILIKN